MRPAVQADLERAARLRAQSRRLRVLADELLEEATALENEAYGPDVLRGPAAADAAAAILEREGTLHYRDLAARVMATTGVRITGRDPEATLLASMYRDDRFECVRSRSGLYRLRAAA